MSTPEPTRGLQREVKVLMYLLLVFCFFFPKTENSTDRSNRGQREPAAGENAGRRREGHGAVTGSAGRTHSYDVLRLIQFFPHPLPSTRAKIPAFQQSNNQTIKPII